MIEEPAANREAFAVLSRFRRRPRPQQGEVCELCAAELPSEHPHVLNNQSRAIACACEPCAVLFSYRTDGKFQRVPRDSYLVSDFLMSDAAWNSLAIPIGLAFLMRRESRQPIAALYPSPGGAIEAHVDPEDWAAIERDNPILGGMKPAVQALLVNRVHEARDYYLAPIDRCYKLVGLIRTQWKGFGGGEEVWASIADFFENLKRQSRAVEREARIA